MLNVRSHSRAPRDLQTPNVITPDASEHTSRGANRYLAIPAAISSEQSGRRNDPAARSMGSTRRRRAPMLAQWRHAL